MRFSVPAMIAVDEPTGMREVLDIKLGRPQEFQRWFWCPRYAYASLATDKLVHVTEKIAGGPHFSGATHCSLCSPMAFPKS